MNDTNHRKVGVWLLGALGSISATVICGALALRKGLANSTGMVTLGSAFEGLGLIPVEDLEFGGCDVRMGSLGEALSHFARETGAIPTDLLEQIQGDLAKVDREIHMGTARNCGEAIERLAVCSSGQGKSVRREIADIREWFRSFKAEKCLEDLIVINLASTEPSLPIRDCHKDLCAFEDCLDGNDTKAFKASTLYAYAAIQEGCPYINFTPSNAALVPAMIELAEQKRVPVMGNDGKTGETLVKSALAPMFLYRNLEVLSWEGFNLLGNRDGSILNHPDNRETKIKTKDQVLAKVLGYSPHSKVHIDYVPSLEDQKTAWDFIHFRGFLGAKMSLQFVWQGFDSILAAPLILDLVRLADLAKRRGESGLMPHLASYFKAPLGVDEYRLHEQFQMLMDYVRHAGTQ